MATGDRAWDFSPENLRVAFLPPRDEGMRDWFFKNYMTTPAEVAKPANTEGTTITFGGRQLGKSHLKEMVLKLREEQSPHRPQFEDERVGAW